MYDAAVAISSRDLLDHPLIGERYFFPRPDRVPDAFVVDTGEAQLACYRACPHAGARTVLHFHGNGEVVADYVPEVSDVFHRMGLNVLFAEYRGYGGSSGVSGLGSMLGDVEALFEAAGGRARDVIVFGRSVGSIFAIELVHRHPGVAGLILESGIADVHQRLALRVRPEELRVDASDFRAATDELLDHDAKLGGYRGPLLVLHTRHDGLIDLPHAQRNHDACPSADKTLRVFDHGDHNSIMAFNWRAYWSEVESFVERLE